MEFNEDGRTICPRCNGKKYKRLREYKLVCSKCRGVGYLDWIEVIVGKKLKPFNMDFPNPCGEVIITAQQKCYLGVMAINE